MRILFLTHRLPYPPNKGDKIRSYNILCYLIKNHEIYLGSLIDDKNDIQYVAQLQSQVKGFVFETIRSQIKKIFCLRSLLKKKSVSVCYFYSSRLQKKIDALFERIDFDVILCFSSPMAEYYFRSTYKNRAAKPMVRIMDLIDVDSYKWVQYAEQATGLKRLIYHYEARYLLQYEHQIAGTFDHLLLVSEQEKKIFLQELAAPNINVVTNGVNLDFFNPSYPQGYQIQKPALVFTGVMDYWPNIEGVCWFVESIFSLIRSAFPEVVFYIVGSRPAIEIKNLERTEGVVVTGFVEDVRDYLAAAAVCVVPLRIARGIQNKILEAMAMGKPVVTTPQAFEGIKAVPDEEIITAESEESFAAAVINLLKNPAQAQRIGEHARLCVEKHYSWENNLRILDKLLLEPIS
ncbi:putative Sugar transferase, PEP-CTERM/EpsH1 system associated [Candidatus Competibacter denitrificans Run_A_D11]|mgnify:CR=1 FL=1|uniref:Sugar transferase, PEP-CTERM/EpsH1 system associated n=1 Tax=Candidatus Competibacter denitrificans Run_A_D11 TaxID=1400863 RepID=W6M8Q6_9GAMM|nr:TIGR03087 family PEP-CTERM/XrtA system glycosyltransferase [Candidatus Competibacter denitrificans]CDI03957.1 putative Sugar transferase, PEP-CTERM/EpsH1 system associated [Candidatus Competibacter denitrificans Run_A_D11]